MPSASILPLTNGASLHSRWLAKRLRSDGLNAMTTALSVLVTLILVCAAGSKGHAAGPDKNRVQHLINDGLDLRRAGKDTDALAKFEEAHRLLPTPRSSAQLGLCLQALGRWSEADVHLSDALNAKTDPWVVKNRSTLKDSSEEVKQNVGRVEVNGGPDGALVSINGRNMGTYPLPGALPVNAGNVDIEVTKSGFKRALRSITIAGGHYQRILIRLEETDKGPDSVVSAEPLSVGGPDAALGSIASTPAADAAEPRPIYREPWAWVIVGALIVGGVVAFGVSANGGGATSPTPDDRRMFE